MIRHRLVPALAATALLASACGTSSDVDLGPVRDAVDALDSAQGDLRTRLTELEQALATMGSISGGDDDGAASTLVDQLQAIQDAIDELELALEQETLDRSDGDTNLSEDIAALQSLLSALEGDLSSLKTDVQSLREEHELLKSRFDRHLQDHG